MPETADSTSVREIPTIVPCSAEPCGEAAAAELTSRWLCAEHFLAESRGKIETGLERLKNQPFDPEAMEAFQGLLTEMAAQAGRLTADEQFEDATRAKFAELLFRIAQVRKSLRRSPRVSASVAVWLRREDPGRTWEEETWTSTVSRHGAGFSCRHPVEAGGTLVLLRRDRGSRAAARVVYARMDSQGWRQIGVELIDRDDFWN